MYIQTENNPLKSDLKHTPALHPLQDTPVMGGRTLTTSAQPLPYRGHSEGFSTLPSTNTDKAPEG